MDSEGTISLIRAIIASKKGPISLDELESEYKEMENTKIPFRAFGFNTLVEFLKTARDKLQLSKDPYSQSYTVKVVLDSEISRLRQLVVGQASSNKKKKSKPVVNTRPYYSQPTGTYSRFNMANHNHSSNNNHNHNHNNNNNNNNNNNHRTIGTNNVSKKTKMYKSNSFIRGGQTQKQQQSSNAINYKGSSTATMKKSFNPNPIKITIPEPLVSKRTILSSIENTTASNMSSTTSLNNAHSNNSNSSNMYSVKVDHANTEQIDQLWIENAAYFLKEHEVELKHVLDVCTVYVCLIGDEFSGKLDQLAVRMRQFYERNSAKLALKTVDPLKVCVAFNPIKKNYMRVQIKKAVNPLQVNCFCVDSGKTVLVNKKNLFEIDNEFLQVKFQSIKVKLNGMDSVNPNNEYLINVMKKYLDQKFIAKRVSNQPLQVDIYLTDNYSKSFNQIFLQQHEHFIQFRPVKDETFSAQVTFIDQDNLLTYLAKPFCRKYYELFEAVNTIFSINLPKTSQFDLTAEDLSQQNEAHLKSQLYLVKYELDSQWYRAQIQRVITKEKLACACVQFVDYGNREFVSLSDVKKFPADTVFNMADTIFAEFKYMAHQAQPCSVIENNNRKLNNNNNNNKQSSSINLKECLYESILINVRVEQVNTLGIPSIEVLSMVAGTGNGGSALNQPTVSENCIPNQIESPSPSLAATAAAAVAATSSTNQEFAKVENLKASDLKKMDLPVSADVFISYSHTPLDFVLNLDSSKLAYQDLVSQMNSFYRHKPHGFQPIDKLQSGSIYIHQNDNLDCKRIQLIEPIDNIRCSVYDIDKGCYDALRSDELFYIAAKFVQLQPQAIKAQLVNIGSDLGDTAWSETAKKAFKLFTMDKKLFRSQMISYKYKTDVYTVDLTYRDGNNNNSDQLLSVGQYLVEKAFAKRTTKESN